MRKILKFIFKLLAKRVISRYRPMVIGITGSVGKTTAKEAIFAVLSSRFWVRKNEENYNNEFGVPMAVLGIAPEKFHTTGYKLKTLFSSCWLAFGFFKSAYPKALVLELAADRPGDIGYLTDIIKPRIGVITAVGEIPVHVEFYASPETVAKEKAKLVETLPAHDGLAILNYDDQTVLDMAKISKAKVITISIGFSAPIRNGNAGPDIWISDISYFGTDDNKNIGGLSFKINQANGFIPARINNLVGIHQLYGVLAAVAVGLNFGINMVEISRALENIDLPHGRMTLLRGIKNSMIIDDSYNSSPVAVHAALDTLRDFAKAKNAITGGSSRKIAILGDMKELGKYEIEAHQAVGNFAAERTNILITVGPAAKFIADSAANQMKVENILSFNTSDEAKTKVQEIIKKGDIVLVKGSRSMQMEKIVEKITAP